MSQQIKFCWEFFLVYLYSRLRHPDPPLDIPLPAPISSDTHLTSRSQHPSGDHYKLEVTTCTLQSLHLCVFLQSPCAVHIPFTSPLLEKKKKVTCFIMFPPAQACGLRYKAMLSDCRKQSQEMEMHCVTSSATSGYLFRQIFLLFFFMGIPFPPSLLESQSRCLGVGETSLQCRVAC